MARCTPFERHRRPQLQRRGRRTRTPQAERRPLSWRPPFNRIDDPRCLVGAEHAPPQAVPKHDDAVLADDAVFRVKRAPELRHVAQHVEEVRVTRQPAGSCTGSPPPVRSAARRSARPSIRSWCSSSSSRRSRRARRRCRSTPSAGRFSHTITSSIGLVVRQRAQERRVHRREDRRVGADAQRQRQHREGRRGRAAGRPGAPRMTRILPDRPHRRPPSSRLRAPPRADVTEYVRRSAAP